MTRPDLVVHVGLGASVVLLSAALPLLEAELARHGIRVATTDATAAVGGAPVLVVPSAPPVVADPPDAWAFCSLDAADVARVIAAAGARRATVVFCPERQDRLIERTFRAAVAEGFSGTLADLFPRATEPGLDYGPVASAFAGIDGVSDVRVLPLEQLAGAPALLAALLAPLGPFDLGALEGWDGPRELGRRGTRIARSMAPHLDTDDERARVREYLLANFSVPTGASPEILPDSRREQLVAAYRPLNQAFLERWAPDFSASDLWASDLWASALDGSA